MQLFAEHGLAPELIETWAEFKTAKTRCCLGVSPLHHGVLFENAADKNFYSNHH